MPIFSSRPPPPLNFKNAQWQLRELFGLGLVDEKSRIGDHHRLILTLKRGQKAKTNRQFCTPLAAGQSPSIKRIEDLPVTYTYFSDVFACNYASRFWTRSGWCTFQTFLLGIPRRVCSHSKLVAFPLSMMPISGAQMSLFRGLKCLKKCHFFKRKSKKCAQKNANMYRSYYKRKLPFWLRQKIAINGTNPSRFTFFVKVAGHSKINLII